MKSFVTGGTGFIGKALVRKLVERGDEVYTLVRTPKGAEEMQAAGTHPIIGDITDIESMREGMRGSDRVFHVAGWYLLGSRDQDACELINVQGTRYVLNLAADLGIPKIVYTSTVAVFGDTHGRMVDETYHMPADQDFLTEYDRSKWKAQYEVAQPLMERGAPVIIVQPGAVYGPGDQSLVGDMMHRFYTGQLPFPLLPGPELTLTFAHVDDIAEGHILAAERGRPGESYILAGPAVPMGEMVKIWSQLTGKREPMLQIPARFVKPFAPVMDGISRIIPLPEIFSRDTLSILDATYTARPDKARQELGWSTRPVEEGMRQTFEWIAQTQDTAAPEKSTNRWIATGFAVTAALSVLLIWLVSRRDRKD